MNLQDLSNRPYARELVDELVDFVADKLNGQYQSIDESGNCVYRNSNGDKCAVGHLITDEQYNSCFDDDGYSSTRVVYSLNLNIDPRYTRAFLVIQRVHDEYQSDVPISKDTFVSIVREKLQKECLWY